MKEKIQTFIQNNPEKIPLFLINFPVGVSEDKTTLVPKMRPVNGPLLDMIASMRKEIDVALLLLVDDKPNIIYDNTPRKILYGGELRNIRKNYFKGKTFPKEVTDRGLEDIVYKPKRGKQPSEIMFSEEILAHPHKRIMHNNCAQMYHTLLANHIDRQKYILISLFPRLCYNNLSAYLTSDTADTLQDQTQFAVQTIFVDSHNSNAAHEFKIIEL